MRATQEFINQNFDSLIFKIGVTNPDLKEALITYDPELQYRILRVFDRMDSDLFKVSVTLGTAKWLDSMCDNIISYEAKKILDKRVGEPDVYIVSGYTKDEIKRLLADGNIEKAVTDRCLRDLNIFRKTKMEDPLEGIKTEIEVTPWYKKPMPIEYKAATCAGLVGLVIGAVSFVLGKNSK